MDKTADVHVDECRHKELTIESVHYTTMSRDYIAKILIKIQKSTTSIYDKKALTLILKALLNPEAKNPPKGPITLLNKDKDNECSIKG